MVHFGSEQQRYIKSFCYKRRISCFLLKEINLMSMKHFERWEIHDTNRYLKGLQRIIGFMRYDEDEEIKV